MSLVKEPVKKAYYYAEDPKYREFFGLNIAEPLAKIQELKRLLSLRGKSTRFSIIHDNDPDGWASAYLFQYLLKVLGLSAAELHCVNHGAAFHAYDETLIYPGTDVLIVLDHCVKAEDEDRLLRQARNIVVVDHHEDTITRSSHGLVFHDTRWSTTALVDGLLRVLLEHYPERSALPVFARLVDHEDKWRYNVDPMVDKSTREFIAYCYTEGMSEIPWKRLVEAETLDDLVHYTLKGECVYRIQAKMVDGILGKKMVLKSLMWEDTEKVFALVFSSHLHNEIASSILRKYRDDIDFVAIVNVSMLRPTYRISLRSTDAHMAVDSIATQMGGGGHRNAAGFQVDAVGLRRFIREFRINL